MMDKEDRSFHGKLISRSPLGIYFKGPENECIFFSSFSSPTRITNRSMLSYNAFTIVYLVTSDFMSLLIKICGE